MHGGTQPVSAPGAKKRRNRGRVEKLHAPARAAAMSGEAEVEEEAEADAEREGGAAAPEAPEDEEASCEAKLRAVSVSLKRPAPESGDEAEAEGGAKRLAPGAADGESVTFRLLVPARCTGPLIGRGGAAVQRVRDATGASIRVLEPTAGCEERIVELSSGAGEGDAPPPAQARPCRDNLTLVGVPSSRCGADARVSPRPRRAGRAAGHGTARAVHQAGRAACGG
jgi:hypothetical protein